MRYHCPVTEFVNSPALTHLSGSERRLSALLARPRWIAAACIVVLTASGWVILGLMAADAGWSALCRPGFAAGWNEFALALAMWAAMSLAMMLPTAGPMILTYAEIADTAVRKREPVVSPLVLTAGYLAVWFGFAVAAAAMQIALATAGWLDPEAWLAGSLLAAALFIAAGLYQFSAVKLACLAQCHRPFPFFFANWTSSTGGVFRLGLRQGLYCLGCCWALMLLMFVTGAMNVIWMAALGIVMIAEKLSGSARLSRAIGFSLIAAGLGLMTVSFLQMSGS